MADSERYILTGSDRGLPEAHTRLADVDPDEIAMVAVYAGPRAGIASPDEAGETLSPGRSRPVSSIAGRRADDNAGS